MGLSTGKIAEVFFESVLEGYEDQDQLVNKVSFSEPDAGTMQNAGNVIWRPVEQHAAIQEGWDLTGKETGIIEETYPAILETPKNDFVKLRADDMRDKGFWERRGKRSGKQQVTELNSNIAARIALQGSLHVRSNVTSGYEFIGAAQALMNERQGMDNGRCFVLNDRDNLTFGSDLAGRQTLQGRPEQQWKTGMIAQNVAGFDDVFTGSYLTTVTGAAAGAVTVTGAQSFAPEAGTVDSATGIVTNVDYRTADIPVNNSALLSVGDKVTIGAVQSVGLADKNATGQLMTFSVIALPDATTITVYPKPIAAVDPALSTIELAYANIDVVIPNAAAVTRLNIDASKKANLFFDKEAVEVIGGSIPAELFSENAGFKVLSETMPNGLKMYLVYDASMPEMTFRYRCFTWYGITIADPSRCGIATTF
jgi:hypothetical protein